MPTPQQRLVPSIVGMLSLLLVAVPAVAVVVPAAAADAPAPVVPGELIVRFEPGASASERAAARARNGLRKLRDLPVAGVELVRFDTSEHPGAKADRMRLERSVRWAEPNQLWQPGSVLPPDDTRFVEQWALHNIGQTGGTSGADIGALDAGDVAADTSGVVVAVIDTGVDISHPDLADQLWSNAAEAAGTPGADDDGNGYIDDVHGWDFLNDDASVYDAVDGERHGTHVAGTIAAATNNGQHVAGVSNARLMPLKFLGPDGGTTADAVQALDYAIEMGARITNNSWGGAGRSQVLADKIAEAEKQGVFVVAAAGNAGADNDATPSYPATYPNANVISVAATDHHDQLASFSNYGAASVDLGAPGARIVSTLPGGTTGTMSGTSMAAPHVSGALAHVLAAFPTLSATAAKDLLLARTQPVAALDDKIVSGGRLDLAQALGVGVPAAELSVADASVTEGNTGTQASLSFSVTLSKAHPQPVTARWDTGGADDTATADLDYAPVSAGEVTVPAGETGASVTVPAIGDDEVEDSETITVTLSSPTEATIAAGVATGTVVDDDTAPPPSGGSTGGGTIDGGGSTGGGSTGGGSTGGGGSTDGGSTGGGGSTDGGTTDDGGSTDDGTPDGGTADDTVTAEPKPAPGVIRTAGADRLGTAIAVSQATWGDQEARSVVLARADNYPDALAGGALAVSHDGPLLLTGAGSLDAAVADEVRRVLPAGGTVRLLGGTAAMSPALADSLQGLGFRVERISGADRFATAVAIAGRLRTTPAAILVTTGSNFPDALAASAAAGHLGGVVVLTDGRNLPGVTADYLARHGDVPVYAVGGPAAAALEGTVPRAVPIVGADRYRTAALVADRLFETIPLVGVATGENFPDALAAGARLGRLGAPLLLSPRASLPESVKTLAAGAERAELFGGAGVLSDAVRDALLR